MCTCVFACVGHAKERQRAYMCFLRCQECSSCGISLRIISSILSLLYWVIKECVIRIQSEIKIHAMIMVYTLP